MEYLEMPRFDAPTTEGKMRQMEDWIFRFIQKYNYNLSETERQLALNKEDE